MRAILSGVIKVTLQRTIPKERHLRMKLRPKNLPMMFRLTIQMTLILQIEREFYPSYFGFCP